MFGRAFFFGKLSGAFGKLYKKSIKCEITIAITAEMANAKKGVIFIAFIAFISNPLYVQNLTDRQF